jgi:hypothetical protein
MTILRNWHLSGALMWLCVSPTGIAWAGAAARGD